MLLGVLALASGACVWGVRASQAREMQWDGATWSLAAGARVPAVSGDLTVTLDLQRLLLVHFRTVNAREGCWLWLNRSAMPERWAALRRAAYCRAPVCEGAPASEESGNGGPPA